MITIADIPVNVPDLEISDWLANNIDPERAVPWVERSWPGLGLTAVSFPTGFRIPKRIRINSFLWPVGASRWSYGFFLCDSQLLKPIEDAAFGTSGKRSVAVPLVMSTATSPPQNSDEKLTTNVYILPPTPLSYLTPKDGPSLNNLWLLTVVDIRYYWWNAQFPAVSIPDEGMSWSSLFSMCTSSIGTSIILDTISPSYLNAGPSFNLSNEAIPIVMDALAWNVGHRLARTFDGVVYTQAFQKATDTFDANQKSNPNRAIRAGGERFVDIL